MFVYILGSKTRVIYVGVMNDLVRRIWEHRSGAIAGFTHRYGLDRLVYYEASRDPAGAISREKQIKGWARVKKVAMIETENPEWRDLAEDWFVDVSSGRPLTFARGDSPNRRPVRGQPLARSG
jgi:putative endonuclease